MTKETTILLCVNIYTKKQYIVFKNEYLYPEGSLIDLYTDYDFTGMLSKTKTVGIETFKSDYKILGSTNILID